MKKRWLALIAAALLLIGCGAQTVGEGDASGTAVELPADEMVLGTVYDTEIPYTNYRLYLDLSDSEYQMQLRQVMAFNSYMELEMNKLGIAFDDEAFETYAAEQYYTEVLFQPRLIDEIEAAASSTGLLSDSMNLALYEGYRQSYDTTQIGDYYAAEYIEKTPLSDTLDEETRESESIQYANDKLSELIGQFSEDVEVPVEGDTLCTIDGQEIPMEDRHKAFLILAVARSRISLADSILIGEGMLYEMKQADYEPDLSQFEESVDQYFEQLKTDEEFQNTYLPILEKQGKTLDEAFLSIRCALRMMSGMDTPYSDFISQEYEKLSDEEKEDLSQEDYYTQRCEALYEKCVSVNPMG